MPFRRSLAAGISQSVFGSLPRSEGSELGKVAGRNPIASTELGLLASRPQRCIQEFSVRGSAAFRLGGAPWRRFGATAVRTLQRE